MSTPAPDPALLFTLLRRPRATIARLLKDSDPRVEAGLAGLAGIAVILGGSGGLKIASRFEDSPLLIQLLAGVPVGLAGWLATAAVYTLAGGWLGGCGDFRMMRTVVAWSLVPLVLGLALLLPLAVAGVAGSGHPGPMVLGFLLAVYTSGLAVLFLAIAHGLSLFRAVLTQMLGALVLGLGQLVAGMLF
jgi:hypothetical protein